MYLSSSIARLSSDRRTKLIAESHGLNIMDVAWEDCARTKGSSWGPNITDMTLSVYGVNMPIIRKPNFADITSDQAISKFNVTVGNEGYEEKKIISFKEYLENISVYTKNNNLTSMYLPRDEKILVSSQACILPLQYGKCEFNVKLYNYQSSDQAAILVIVCSSEGTSCQIIKGRENILYFNKNGSNANYVAERLSEDRKRRGVESNEPMTNEEKQRNALLIFQIPLKKIEINEPSHFKHQYKDFVPQSEPSHFKYQYKDFVPQYEDLYSRKDYQITDMLTSKYMITAFDKKRYSDCRYSDSRCDQQERSATLGFENAVLSSSEAFGRFSGTRGEKLVRDEKYPIRCTVQYYKVTDTTEISDSIISELATQINKQYNLASSTERGSLVLENSLRDTESNLPKLEIKDDSIMFNTASMLSTL